MTVAAVRDRERVGACRAEDGHAKPDVDARYRDKDHPVLHSGYGSDLLLLESRKSMESVQTLRRQPSEGFNSELSDDRRYRWLHDGGFQCS